MQSIFHIEKKRNTVKTISSSKMTNTRLGVICLVLCLSLAVTCAEEEHASLRVKRITCGGIVEERLGSRACNAHCRFRGRARGSCSGGTCYCSRG